MSKFLAFIFLLIIFDVDRYNVLADETKISFKVASIQFNPQLNERNKNIEDLKKLVIKAADNGAKLIVTPEMATTGYHYKDREAIKPFVDTIPGLTTKIFGEISKRYGVYVVVGLPEMDNKTGIYYNSAALVGPYGYIGKYRKIHLWETDAHWAASGDLGVQVFKTEIGNIAVNICMDSVYFETFRLAALEGANIMAFLTNSSAQSIWHLQSRAIQNGIYIISANRSNREKDFHMVGASAIWSPYGEKLAEGDFYKEERGRSNNLEIIYAEIDPSNYHNNAKTILNNRVTSLYKDLLLYISPWDFKKSVHSHNINVAVLQYEPALYNKRSNLLKIEQLIDNAVKKASINGNLLDLVVLPELSLTGRLSDIKEAEKYAEKTDGFTVKNFKELACKNKVFIIFGMAEKDENNKFYNIAVIIGKNGEFIGKYRKTHLDEIDIKWAKSGEKIVVIPTEIGRIGIMIGSEILFPEIAGVLAVKRSDIIVIPSSWADKGAKVWLKEIQANPEIPVNKYPDNTICLLDSIALTAQAYTIFANFIGSKNKYIGKSAVYTLDPLYGLDWSIVASSNKDEMLMIDFTTIQPNWWFNQEKMISSRKPYLYKALIY